MASDDRLGKVSESRFTASGLRIAEDALSLIAMTPLVGLRRVAPPGGSVVAKVEFLNPAGSVKDRPALQMILAAERAGHLKPGSTIVEATSGNTGISLAMIAAVRGYRCMLVMPEDMSLERRYILRAYGADIVLTPAADGMSGAVSRAMALLAETPDAFMPSQFKNPANPESHELGTAREILEQTSGNIAAFVAGVGTGGTITGVARVLRKELGKRVKIVAVEPANSAVLSGKPPGMHGIQGLGAGFVPDLLERGLIDEVVEPANSAVLSGKPPGMHGIQGLGAGFVPDLLERGLIDEVVEVTDVAAERMARRLAREEGLLVGPSSGANVHAACEVASRVGSGNVVTILCDSGERYLF